MDDIKKIKVFTVSLTLLLWVVSSFLYSSTVHAAWDHNNVMGTSECAECHEDEVDAWKKTAHQKNFKALSKNKDAKKIAKKMGVKKIKKDTAMCAGCHYTVGNKKNKAKIVAGVSCESCHSPAKEWIDIHNNYGGKGINKKSESASHKKTRYKKLESLNMIRPDNTYGWAKNCLNCHIVANEKLVNTGGHKAGSDFKLSKRTQGKIRHYPKADVDTLHYYNLISYSTELEVSLAALSEASGGKYAKEMQKRANASLENLKSANDTTPNSFAKKIITLADNTSIEAGNQQLSNVAKSISVTIMQMVQQETGYAYDSSKLKLESKNIAKKPAPTPKPEPKIIKKPKSTIAKKPTISPKPAPIPIPAPIKKTVSKTTPEKSDSPKIIASDIKSKPVKQNKKVTATPTPEPIQKTSTVLSEENIAPTKQSTDNKLLEEFNIIVPRNFALCQTYTPWTLGKQQLSDTMSIAQDGCFGINIKAGRTAQFYLFMESENNNLIRLAPNNCNYLGIKFNALSAHQAVSIPKPGYTTAAISVNELPDYNKIYIIIADNAYANSEMSRLSSNTTSMCNTNEFSTETNNTNQGLDGILKAIKKSAGKHMEWKMQKIQ